MYVQKLGISVLSKRSEGAAGEEGETRKASFSNEEGKGGLRRRGLAATVVLQFVKCRFKT